MAVSLDVGQADNVHPPDKQTVGARLALAARALSYREGVAYASPLFRQATFEGTAIRVWLDHADGLTAPVDGLQGFELAGDDHAFYPAEAVLDGDTVLVRGPGSSRPRYVRYGWSGVVPQGFKNSAGLPASTFTSEEAPIR